GKVKLGYVASWATQTDYGDNPLTFDLDYTTAELTATYKQFGLGAGIEVMEGNGVKGFTTPLATLHKFQGWADKFLTTPVDGIDDRYLTAGIARQRWADFDALAIVASYHRYTAERGSTRFGSDRKSTRLNS